MARVLIEHVSDTLFKSVEEAQLALDWIRDKLNKGADNAPYPNKIIPVEGGFRYVTYGALDVEIPTEEFEARKANFQLPACFDNQSIVLIDDAKAKE